jgi:hypothetical protein
VTLDLCQKRAGRDSQAVGDSQNQGERRLSLAALQLAEVGAIDVREERELILGHVPLQPLRAHDRPEGGGDVGLKRCGSLGNFGVN